MRVGVFNKLPITRFFEIENPLSIPSRSRWFAGLHAVHIFQPPYTNIR
jgi:hypothetical protein